MQRRTILRVTMAMILTIAAVTPAILLQTAQAAINLSGGGGNSSRSSNSPPPQYRQVTQPNSDQSFDWLLTVNVRNVNLGQHSIEVSVKGPFGYSDHQNIPNVPSPSASFNIPGGTIPAGHRFEVCVGTGIGASLPRCTPFIHSQDADSIVTVSP